MGTPGRSVRSALVLIIGVAWGFSPRRSTFLNVTAGVLLCRRLAPGVPSAPFATYRRHIRHIRHTEKPGSPTHPAEVM